MNNPNCPILNNRYQLVQELGSGNTADVFLANDLTAPGNQYAVKIMKQNWLEKDQATLSFVEEANISVKLAQLKCESLMTVHEAGIYGSLVRASDNNVRTNVHYLLMEYVPMGMLFDFSKKKGALGEDGARFFCK